MNLLDPSILTHYQQCQRRHALERTHRVIHHRPKTLLDRCLREGVTRLHAGDSAADALAHAYALFMEQAADPGLYAPGHTTYTLAKDSCALLGTVLEYLSRCRLLVTKPAPPVQLSLLADITWRSFSEQDDSGQLHRWVTVDSWDEDAATRAAHAWYTIGEIAVYRVPMMLHVVEIGRMRGARRDSPWCRAYRHPSAPNLPVRFRKSPDNRHLSADDAFSKWTVVRLADQVRAGYPDWVDKMMREGVAQDLVKHATVKCPSDAACDEIVRQMLVEASAMQHAPTDWLQVPMSRAACDGMVPCPWQNLCYGGPDVKIDSLGLYEKRSSLAPNNSSNVRGVTTEFSGQLYEIKPR